MSGVIPKSLVGDGVQENDVQEFVVQPTKPENPAPGSVRLYPNADGDFIALDSDGNETNVAEIPNAEDIPFENVGSNITAENVRDAIETNAMSAGAATTATVANAAATAANMVALTGKQDVSEKGQPEGYAGLGADGLVPASQLPAIGGAVNISSNDFEVTGSGTDTITINLPAPEIPDGSVAGFVYSARPAVGQTISRDAWATVAFEPATFGSATDFDGTVYTAPVTGVYYFNATCNFANRGLNANSSLLGSFLVNGTTRHAVVSKTEHGLNAQLYTTRSATAISLQQGDTVVYQAQYSTGAFHSGATADTDALDFPTTPRTGTVFDTGPYGFFSASLHGDIDSAEAVVVSNLANVTLNQGSGGTSLGLIAPLDTEQLNTLGSYNQATNTFTAITGGTYAFDAAMVTTGGSLNRQQYAAINYRVTRANGDVEVYLNNANNSKGNSSAFAHGGEGATLIGLEAGETVETFIYSELLTSPTSAGVLAAGSSLSIIRISDSSTYVNARDTRTSAVTVDTETPIITSIETSDPNATYDGTSITIPEDGLYAYVAQVGFLGRSSAITHVRKDGVVLDFSAGGANDSTSTSQSQTASIEGVRYFLAGEVLTFNFGVRDPVNLSPVTTVGNTTTIPGYVQLVKVINDAPEITTTAESTNATDVGYDNTASGLAAEDVQAAIDELVASGATSGAAGTGAGGTTDNSDTSTPPPFVPEIGVFPNDGFVHGSKPLQSQVLGLNTMTTISYSVPTTGSQYFDGVAYTAPATGVYYFDASVVFGNDTIDTNVRLVSRYIINEGLASERTIHVRRETAALGVQGIYGVHGSAPISLLQNDTVRFQVSQFDTSTSDNPNTTFTVGSNGTSNPFDINQLPMGHFDVVFLGAETEAEIVQAVFTGIQSIPVGAGSVEVGEPLSIEGVQLDTQGSIVNGSFIARFGGVYKFDLDLIGSGSTTSRSAVNLRVNRINGTSELYHNVEPTLKTGTTHPGLDGVSGAAFNGQNLIRLAIGESVDILAQTNGLSVINGSAVSIIRVSNSDTYVNAYDTRTDTITSSATFTIEGATELEDVQGAYDMGSFTVPASGTYFLLNKLTITGGGFPAGAAISLKRDGVEFDYVVNGGFAGFGSHFHTYNMSRMYHLEENEVITATLSFNNHNDTFGTGINDLYPSSVTGNTTDIYGGFQATLVTNDAPPVAVLPPAEVVVPAGTPLLSGGLGNVIQSGTIAVGDTEVVFAALYANADYVVITTPSTAVTKTGEGFTIASNAVAVDWIAIGQS